MITEQDKSLYTSQDESNVDTNEQAHNGVQPEKNSGLLQEALKTCQAQVAEWQDKYLRVNADLDNVNRRAAKDRALAQYTAQVTLLLPLLTIVDDFERALEQHADFVNTLKEYDIDVILLPYHKKYPEQVFTRDIGFTLGETIFVANMATDARAGEENVLKQWLEE